VRRRLVIAGAAVAALLVAVSLFAFVTPPWKSSLHCRASDGPACREVSGRVVYIEREDPDGDGDAHLVLLGRSSVTRRFITIVKIKRAERPRALPGWGSWVSAVGHGDLGASGRAELVAERTTVR
jgi:hypothetical protein